MPRQFIAIKCPLLLIPAANAYMADLFGDPPGTASLTPNAYVTGNLPIIGTHAFCNANVSQADATTLAAYFASLPGADTRNRAYTAGSYGWDDALALWNLNSVPPII